MAEVRTVVYHSSYLPFVDPNIDDNSRDIAVLALAQPLTFTGMDWREREEDRQRDRQRERETDRQRDRQTG